MEDIKTKIIEKIKIANAKRYLSNCYTFDVIANSNALWETDDGFIFSYEDHGIKRLIYYVKDWFILDKLLLMINGGKYFLEYVTKSSLDYNIKNANCISKLIRLSNVDCSSIFHNGSDVLKFKDAVLVQRAQISDAKNINKMLWFTFHTEISHLLYDEELKEKIVNGDITIHKNNNNEIDALLQAEVLPKKFYINQIVNKTDKQVIHALLLNRLEEYVLKGGKYLYSWVEENNIASIKFHKKYGMVEDGVYNLVYCVER